MLGPYNLTLGWNTFRAESVVYDVVDHLTISLLLKIVFSWRMCSALNIWMFSR